MPHKPQETSTLTVARQWFSASLFILGVKDKTGNRLGQLPVL
jgi:hypothetical protein